MTPMINGTMLRRANSSGETPATPQMATITPAIGEVARPMLAASCIAVIFATDGTPGSASDPVVSKSYMDAQIAILQTQIDDLRKKAFPKKETDAPDKKNLAAIRENAHTCYVCDRIEHDILHLLATVYVQFGADSDFRRQYAAQDFICLDKKAMDKQTAQEFFRVTNKLSKGYMDTLYDDVTHFTTMFDYRNAGGDYKNSKDAIERSVRFLTSYPVDENLK